MVSTPFMPAKTQTYTKYHIFSTDGIHVIQLGIRRQRIMGRDLYGTEIDHEKYYLLGV